jgi:ribonuclease HI
MYFYSVFKGRNKGIFTKWTECFPLINKYPGAIYKRFNNIIDAELFLKNGLIHNQDTNNSNVLVQKNNGENKKQQKNKTNEVYIKEEDEDEDETILCIYTDGSCPNNGNKKATGGIGIHFSNSIHPDISKKIKENINELKITNQKMELIAIKEALNYIINFKKLYTKIFLYTDSQYSLDCILKYSIQWIKNDWKTSSNKDVKHKEIIIEILELYSKFTNLLLKHIKSHTGLKDKHSIGNSKADILAFKAATQKY